LTTDLQGCNKGASQTGLTSPKNAFENNSNNLNPGCNYTSTMNGSSSAAPNLSGAVALMLEANPDLTWRDVKYILAKTAEKVKPNTAPRYVGNYVATQGWVTNAAGYPFHNWYGFGRVDVDAAMTLAKNYSKSFGAFQTCNWKSSGTLNQAIPDYNSTGTSHTLSISDSIKIEAVQIKVSALHYSTGDLGVELVSPSGTKSIMLNIINGFYETNDLSDMVLLSNAFYQENSAGSWTIKVVDGVNLDWGTLTNWKIRFFGEGTCSN
jgi:subtilisin-like proprotein convertase family protein